MQPDISVVIPTYNRHKFLEEAIQSCFHGNDGSVVEVVVVDDGSTDATREYLQQLSEQRVRPIYQEHQGGQVARNRGLDEAQGEYVKFLDDDDWLAAGTLQKEVALLREEGADMCSGGCQFVDREEEPLGDPDFPQFEDLLVGCFEGAVGPQPLRHTYQTSFAKQLCWDEELPCRQDYGFVLEAALERPSHVHSSIVTGYKRQHKGGLSESVESQEESAMVHLRLLQEATETLTESESRVRKAAAKGLWRWGRLNAVRNRQAFLETCGLIQRVCPDFLPPRSNWLLSISDQLFGAKTTELLLLPIRKVKTAVGTT